VVRNAAVSALQGILIADRRKFPPVVYGWARRGLPFTLFPENVAGKHVIFYVDNMAVVYGWERGGLKRGSTADSILKTVHILASFLGTRVYVRHVRRVSNEMSDLADDLTRRYSPMNTYYRKCLEKAKYVPPNYDILQEIMSNSKIPMYITMLMKIKK